MVQDGARGCKMVQIATNEVSRQNSVSMRSFAIDEPGSLVRALYATLMGGMIDIDVKQNTEFSCCV